MPQKSPLSQVRLKDVAIRAGVALSTASAALKGDGRVALPTRELVETVAKQMGYRPNKAAAMLASKDRWSTEAYTIVFLTAVMKNSLPLLASLGTLEGVKTRADELGYRLEHVNLDGTRPQSAVSRSLYMRGVAGIIIGRMWPVMPTHIDFEWDKFSVVYCGREHVDEVRPHGVEHDVFEATLRMFREVASRGYRRIGVCLRAHTPRLLDDDARLGAVLAAQHEIPAADRVTPYFGNIVEGMPQAESERLSNWVKSEHVDAVIGFNETDYWSLRQRGWKIPEDIGYADMHLALRGSEIAFAGLLQDREAVGRAAVDLIDQQIRHRLKGLSSAPISVSVVSRWRDGETLPVR